MSKGINNILNNTIVSLFENNKSTTPKESISLQLLVDAIRTGKVGNTDFVKTIEQIRNTTDDKERNKLKGYLPNVTLSGQFSQRNKNSLIAYAGLMQIDFDKMDNLVHTIAQLQKDAYSLCTFTSPSGNGIKIIVRVSDNKDNHLQSFEKLEAYYLDKYSLQMDKSVKDISRIMYLSYDPDIYINENALPFITAPVPKSKASPKAVHNNHISEYEDKRDEVERIISIVENNGIDITSNYEDWIKIGFAFATYFKEAGRDYFHRISRSYHSYDYKNANNQYNECLKDRQAGAVNINTFFQIVKDNGIDISRKGITYSSQAPKAHSTAKRTTQQETKPNNEVLDLYAPITIDKNCSTDDFMKEWDFIIRDNVYHVEVQAGKSKAIKPVTNFAMQFLYQFPDGTNNATSLIKLQNKFDEIALLEVDAKTMTSLQNLKAALKSKGNFHIYGNPTYTIDRMQEYHNLEYKRAKEIKTLGYQSDGNFYAFSNGIVADNKFMPVDNMGIVQYNNEYYYLPSFSMLNENSDEYTDVKKFYFQKGKIGLKEYADLLIKAYGDSALVGLSYLIATIHRDIIFDYKNNFPYLFLFGTAGAGKTSFINMLMQVFGKEQDGTSLSNATTLKGIVRKTAQYKNAIVYFKEYSNSGMSNDIITLLKTVYDGVAREKAKSTNDNKTETTKANTGIIIDGNELPEKNSAVFSRCVLLQFPKSDYTDEQSKAFEQLREFAKYGFGKVFLDIWEQRDLIKKHFELKYKEILHQLKKDDLKGMDNERFAEHTALLIAPVNILEINNHISESNLFNSVSLSEKLIKISQEQNETFLQTNEVRQFLDILEMQSQNGLYLYGKHYFIEGKSHIVRMEMNTIYSLYCTEMNKRKGEPLGKSSLINLMFDYGYFIEPIQKDRNKSQKDSKIGTCYRLDTKKAEIKLVVPLSVQ